MAVIGDGAMTAGMAFEALNNAGDAWTPTCWWSSTTTTCRSRPPVGALTNYLARLLSGQLYAAVREGGKKRARSACRRCGSWRGAPRNTSRAW